MNKFEIDNLIEWLNSKNIELFVRLNRYNYDFFNKVTNEVREQVSDQQDNFCFSIKNTIWQVMYEWKEVKNQKGAVEVDFYFRLRSEKAKQTSLSVDFDIENWSPENYVLMPGAVYNGNRFESRCIGYSPKLLDPKDFGPDSPQIISDVPRLNIHEGPSQIQERTGSMTTPAIGFWDKENKQGFWLVTQQATELGDTGITITESRNRKKATISLTIPVVRQLYKYKITDNHVASDDKAPDFEQDAQVNIKFRLYSFKAANIQVLYNRLSEIRQDLQDNTTLKNCLPFSGAYTVQEKKFNTVNWEEEHGYYAVGARDMFLQDWQIGWTGGMISTYPLLYHGSEQTKNNVIRNFNWLFPDGICPAGFFWDCGEGGNKWYGGDIRKPTAKNWHLVRKSGDGIYYIIKQFYLMKKMNISINKKWEEGTRIVTDSFVKLWKNNHQLGNFIDSLTGEIAVGGSTSGGIVPGALALASKYYNNPDYLKTAEEIADDYYKNYLQKGITSGGPGDALQNCDSESSYALVESYTVLYEITGNKKWLKIAEEAAIQFSSWVMAYNYDFPKDCLFGEYGMQSTGAVFANTQNKHGAPGICTHSGVGLFKLYRATGNQFYLDLIRDIAKTAPQYLSHPKRPIADLPAGWMSERISTTDWLEGIGEIVHHTTWAETALMLMFIEIPGVYIEPDKNQITAIDHIDAKIVENTKDTLKVKFSNPTNETAKVKILVENEADKKQFLNEIPLWNCQTVEINPQEEKIVTF